MQTDRSSFVYSSKVVCQVCSWGGLSMRWHPARRQKRWHGFFLACSFLLLSRFHIWTFARVSRSAPEARGSWQVSNYGRCRNLRGVVTTGSRTDTGYHRVRIEGNSFQTHRLVKFAFHGPPESGFAWQVNHLDGNKSNNRLENLQYATPSQNSQHARDNGLVACGGPKVSVRWRAVGSQKWSTCESLTLAAVKVGLSRVTVSRCCRSHSLSKGFEFQLAQDGENASAFCGEEWRPMRDPATGTVLSGRMVSSCGRLKLTNNRISRGHKEENGYFRCCVSGLQRGKEYVHRLVASAFCSKPPSPEHIYVNHKDGDKSNNSACNLEYVTPAGNVIHSYKHASSRSRRCDCKPVFSRLFGSNGRWTLHPSLTSASKILEVRAVVISKCARGQQKHAGGHEFRWADPSAAEDLPGEEWRDVDLSLHLQDRALRR